MNHSIKKTCLALTLCAANLTCADSGQSTGRLSSLAAFFSLPSSASCSQFFASCQSGTKSLFASSRSKYNEPINSESSNRYYTKGNVIVGGSLFVGLTTLVGWQFWSYRKKFQDKQPKFDRSEHVIPGSLHVVTEAIAPSPTNVTNPVEELPASTSSSSPSGLPFSSPVASSISEAAVPAPKVNEYGLTLEEVERNNRQIWSNEELIKDYFGPVAKNSKMILQHAKQYRNAFTSENLALYKQSLKASSASNSN